MFTNFRGYRGLLLVECNNIDPEFCNAWRSFPRCNLLTQQPCQDFAKIDR